MTTNDRPMVMAIAHMALLSDELKTPNLKNDVCNDKYWYKYIATYIEMTSSSHMITYILFLIQFCQN